MIQLDILTYEKLAIGSLGGQIPPIGYYGPDGCIMLGDFTFVENTYDKITLYHNDELTIDGNGIYVCVKPNQQSNTLAEALLKLPVIIPEWVATNGLLLRKHPNGLIEVTEYKETSENQLAIRPDDERYSKYNLMLEGPHCPKPHKWYGQVDTDNDGKAVKVK